MSKSTATYGLGEYDASTQLCRHFCDFAQASSHPMREVLLAALAFICGFRAFPMVPDICAGWRVEGERNGAVGLVGATGFIGRAVTARLRDRGMSIRAILWKSPDGRQGRHAGNVVAQLSPLLEGCASVINCAGRAHVLRKEDPMIARNLFMEANRDLAEAIALAAKAAGVSRLVHVSSVAAIASASAPGERLTDSSPSDPASLYGESKLAGDQRILALADDTFHPVILRPPAVFGPGARGWFPLFLAAARHGLPMPLGRIENARSVAYVGNVADAVVEASLGLYTGAFIVTDSEPMPSGALYRLLLQAAGYGDRVWPIPALLTNRIARFVLGRRASSLLDDAAFEGSRFAEVSDWKPLWNLRQAAARTIAGADA